MKKIINKTKINSEEEEPVINITKMMRFIQEGRLNSVITD